MHCGDQRHLGLCLGYVPALAYGSCRVSDQGTTLRASDLHNARSTILNPFIKALSTRNTSLGQRCGIHCVTSIYIKLIFRIMCDIWIVLFSVQRNMHSSYSSVTMNYYPSHTIRFHPVLSVHYKLWTIILLIQYVFILSYLCIINYELLSFSYNTFSSCPIYAL